MADSLHSTETGVELDPASTMYVTLDLFRQGLIAIADLRRQACLQVLVGPPARRISVAIAEAVAETTLASHQLTLGQFRDVLGDLEDVLVAASEGVSEDRFVAVRTDPERWEDGETEPASQAAEKFRLVGEAFDLNALRQRLWLKATAKTPVPGRFEWEVVAKYADDSIDAPTERPARHALLRITSASPRLRLPLDPDAEVLMTVDEEDLDYMIGSLKRLRQQLVENEGPFE